MWCLVSALYPCRSYTSQACFLHTAAAQVPSSAMKPSSAIELGLPCSSHSHQEARCWKKQERQREYWEQQEEDKSEDTGWWNSCNDHTGHWSKADGRRCTAPSRYGSGDYDQDIAWEESLYNQDRRKKRKTESKKKQEEEAGEEAEAGSKKKRLRPSKILRSWKRFSADWKRVEKTPEEKEEALDQPCTACIHGTIVSSTRLESSR